MGNFEDIFTAREQNEPEVQPNGPYSKDEFTARKKHERDELYALANEMVSDMAVDGGAFQTYLDVQARFDRYSVTNALLIAAQMPEATRLMDFDGWKDAGAYIRRGAEAITILEPGKEFTREDGSTGVYYNPKKVFDISQTDRAGIPPVGNYSQRALLKALINHAPCRFSVSGDLPASRNAMYDPKSNTILVRPGLDGDVYLRSVARELARVMMAKSGKEYADPDFTAYCVSYMVSKRYGVAVESFTFDQLPEAYQDMTPQELRDELGKMRSVSNDLISNMHRSLEAQEKAQSVVARSTSFVSPQAGKLTRSAAPPFPTEPASLGFGGAPNRDDGAR